MSTAKRLRAGKTGLPVYICEHHDDALRCIHHAIRRRCLPFDQVTMVHLDAHPDLGAPEVAASLCSQPHDLYQALRIDKGGIAQWILPAVYTGHLSTVWWVRPFFANQITDGDYQVAVGHAHRRDDAGEVLTSSEPTIHISLAEPYFVEDRIYCEADDMQASRDLRLLVSQMPGEGPAVTPSSSSTASVAVSMVKTLAPRAGSSSTWMLDVCLDYFACSNPFLDQVRREIAEPFTELYNGASFRQALILDQGQFREDRKAFDGFFKELLARLCHWLAEAEEEAEDTVEDSNGASLMAQQVEACLASLAPYLPEARRHQVLSAVRTAWGNAYPSELRQILEASDMVSLPLHRSPADEDVNAALARFEGFLDSFSDGLDTTNAPAIVTIARSVVDGYCPMRWQCHLETSLLEILKHKFGELHLIYSDELDSMDNLTFSA